MNLFCHLKILKTPDKNLFKQNYGPFNRESFKSSGN